MVKKYLNTFLISFVILLILLEYGIFAYFYFYKGNEETPTVEVNEPVIEINDEFYVEVKGAVNSPGVFKVNNDNIINDVITMAGNFKSNAYTNNINLSKKVSKEMVIYVYTNYEYNAILNERKENTKKVIDTKDTICSCPDVDISSCIDKGASIITSDENNSSSDNNEEEKPNEEVKTNETDNSESKVNINTASKENLMSLSGIGEAKAQKIIDYRNENGLFTSIEQIKNVNGISEKVFEQIKEFITI